MNNMEPQKFIENIRNQFVDGESIEINMDSNFRQIESYDSLTGMTIIVMIKVILRMYISAIMNLVNRLTR